MLKHQNTVKKVRLVGLCIGTDTTKIHRVLVFQMNRHISRIAWSVSTECVYGIVMFQQPTAPHKRCGTAHAVKQRTTCMSSP